MSKKRDQSRGIYALAARCGVGMGEACRNIDLSPATPPRWKRGTAPRDKTWQQLHDSILALSQKAGLLPDDLIDKIRPQPAKTCRIVDGMRRIREGLEMIESAANEKPET